MSVFAAFAVKVLGGVGLSGMCITERKGKPSIRHIPSQRLTALFCLSPTLLLFSIIFEIHPLNL
tara:strand:+ start:788 stop:979 length:192 start_codon:yes stop_codon:yes gene_type:complete